MWVLRSIFFDLGTMPTFGSGANIFILRGVYGGKRIFSSGDRLESWN